MAFTTLGLSSAIKSIQRGVYAGAGGDVVISSVDITKTVVISVSKGSSGTVAGRGDITGTLSPSHPWTPPQTPGGGGIMALTPSSPVYPSYSGTRSLSGGTTSLTTKAFKAILKDATNITCDGPCEWQVVEYL